MDAKFVQSIESIVSRSTSSSSEEQPLQPLENAGFVSVLEDALDQIIMLANTGGLLDTSEISLKIDSLKKRCVKYAKNDPIYNCLNGELYKQILYKMKFLKLHLDRLFLEHILKVIREELFDENTYDNIKLFLHDHRNAKLEDELLINDHNFNEKYAASLKSILKRKTDEYERDIKEAEKKIATCISDMETFMFEDALQMSYIENWENARMEQGYMQGYQNEETFINTINKFKNEIEKENRVHAELLNYIAENTKDMEEAIELWSKRYDTELEEKANQLTLYKDKRETQRERYEEMAETYEIHAQEILDWLDYREKKRIRDEIERQRNEAAIRMQRWWRWQMFRHKLGPWNPDPQPIKKKKKKDKKKGKKGKKGKGKGKKKKEN